MSTCHSATLADSFYQILSLAQPSYSDGPSMFAYCPYNGDELITVFKHRVQALFSNSISRAEVGHFCHNFSNFGSPYIICGALCTFLFFLNLI